MDLRIDMISFSKTIEVEEPRFILTLTEEEAKELLAVTGALAPYPESNPKGPSVTTPIYNQLSHLFDDRGYEYCDRRRVRMVGTIPTWEVNTSLQGE